MNGKQLQRRQGRFLSSLTHYLIRYRLLWVCLLFVAVPFLAFPEIIFGGQTLYKTDLTWMHFPRHLFAAEEWLAGRVPLWDPYEDTGIPLLAESQVGVLYPFSLLFLSPLSPSLELSLFILLHFTLAAIFTTILARSLALSWGAATVAGLAFGMGGFLMAQVPNLNIMTGAVWLPLILFGIIQTVRRRSWFVAMLAGLPLALQIFTAQPQIVFYSLVIVLSYALYRICLDLSSGHTGDDGKLRYALHSSLLLVVTIVTALMLAAPQLIPTYELQQLSVRAQERGLDFLTENSLPPPMWANLLLPSAFGNNVTGFKGGDPFQEDFIYVGFIPLLLALFGIASLWQSRGQPHYRDRLFFLLLMVGAAILAMGRFTPVYQIVVQYLPGFGLFRIPARWLMGVNLALAILTGVGAARILARGLSRRTTFALFSVGLLLVAGLILSWQFQAELLDWCANLSGSIRKLLAAFLTRSFTADPAYQQHLLPNWLAGLRVPAWLLIFNVVIAALLFSLLATRRISGNVWAVLLVLTIAVDLTLAGGTTINPTKPADWWWQLSGGAQHVLKNLGTGGNRVFPLGMGSEELTVSHLGQYFPSVYQIRSAGGHGSSLRLERYSTFLQETHPIQAVRVTGTKYLLTEGYISDDAAATYPIVFADDRSIVHENTRPLPRAFVVHRAILAKNPDEALAHFKGLELDPSETVVIEAEQETPLPHPTEATSDDQTTIISSNPQLIEIQTNLTEDGYLVLLDTYYPGWLATINGQRTRIYRANYIGRAVFVPAGKHLVRFEYRPWSFKLGLGLALLAWLAIVAAGLNRKIVRFSQH